MGLGVDRLWLVTLTVFDPGFPFRSGRHLTFDIALSPSGARCPGVRALLD